jgi:hypothetical protein
MLRAFFYLDGWMDEKFMIRKEELHWVNVKLQ